MWANEVADRIGAAVRKRRTELGLSAQGVADRTIELGYPIARGTVSKIENGNRGGKVEVAELIALAEALETSPTALLWNDAPDGVAHLFPGKSVPAGEAWKWFTGHGSAGVTHDSTEVFDSLLAVGSLTRLLDARSAVVMAEHRARGGGDDEQQALVEVLRRVDSAERDAKAHGWTVKGFGDG